MGVSIFLSIFGEAADIADSLGVPTPRRGATREAMGRRLAGSRHNGNTLSTLGRHKTQAAGKEDTPGLGDNIKRT